MSSLLSSPVILVLNSFLYTPIRRFISRIIVREGKEKKFRYYKVSVGCVKIKQMETDAQIELKRIKEKIKMEKVERRKRKTKTG